MENKIIKSLLFAACFVVQATGAMGSSPVFEPAVTEEALEQKIQSNTAELSSLSLKIGETNAAIPADMKIAMTRQKNPKSLDTLISENNTALLAAQEKKRKVWLLDTGEGAEVTRLTTLGTNLEKLKKLTGTQKTLQAEQSELSQKSAVMKNQKEEQERKAEEEKAQILKAREEAERKATEAKLEQERQEEIRRKEAAAKKIQRVFRKYQEHHNSKVKNAAIIQTAFRQYLANKKIKQEQDLVSNFLGFLGGAPSAAPIKGSREEQLMSWIANSCNFFSTNSKDSNADYTLVKTQAKADQYRGLFDLAVSHRSHNITDSDADNEWILKAGQMGDDNLPAAVKLVRRCYNVLSQENADASPGVLKAIAEMAEDTLATGGRIGIDLHRQANKAEMAVMIPALRLSGQRALAAASDNVLNALEQLAKIYLDAAFKSAGFSKPYYEENLFNSHKAHCFIAATRGLNEAGVTDEQIQSVLSDRKFGIQSSIKSVREGYDPFDSK